MLTPVCEILLEHGRLSSPIQIDLQTWKVWVAYATMALGALLNTGKS